MENLRTIKRKANKIHQCGLCLCDIEKGEIYENQSNKIDDYVYTFKSHLKCMGLLCDLDMMQYADEGVTSDIFSECVIEEYIAQIDINYDRWDEGKTIKQLVNELGEL